MKERYGTSAGEIGETQNKKQKVLSVAGFIWLGIATLRERIGSLPFPMAKASAVKSSLTLWIFNTCIKSYSRNQHIRIHEPTQTQQHKQAAERVAAQSSKG